MAKIRESGKKMPEPYDCPYCNRVIAKPETRIGSAKGLFMIHLRFKHPEEYERRLRAERDRILRGGLTSQAESHMKQMRKKSASWVYTTPRFREGS